MVIKFMERYKEALADFNRTIQQNTNNYRAFARRGETYRLMHCYDEALADFNQAITLKPDYVWAFAHRGETHRLMYHYDEALSDFNQAIALKSDYAWAFACRCLCYEQMRRYEEALADFDQTITLNETIFSDWRSDRGLLLNYCGRYAESLEYCEQELRKHPDDYLLTYSLAVTKACLYGRDKAQAQIDQSRTALQSLLPQNISSAVLYRLGGLAALEGNRDQALCYLEQAISLKGGPVETARHDLAWLHLRTDPRFQSLVSETVET